MSVPEGWKLVPLEPTDAMLEAAAIYRQNCEGTNRAVRTSAMWTRMLEAAPALPAENSEAK